MGDGRFVSCGHSGDSLQTRCGECWDALKAELGRWKTAFADECRANDRLRSALEEIDRVQPKDDGERVLYGDAYIAICDILDRTLRPSAEAQPQKDEPWIMWGLVKGHLLWTGIFSEEPKYASGHPFGDKGWRVEKLEIRISREGAQPK